MGPFKAKIRARLAWCLYYGRSDDAIVSRLSAPIVVGIPCVHVGQDCDFVLRAGRGGFDNEWSQKSSATRRAQISCVNSRSGVGGQNDLCPIARPIGTGRKHAQVASLFKV